jgi:hypothetical protein
MAQTQVTCPRCKQSVPANIEQLFDVTADPGAKQRLLGNASNFLHCPFCGFEGPIPTPIVYHDADKELLLTFFPPELGMPVNEQEKLIGPMINKVMENLPAEKRKAYLLSPQSHLTYQSFIERILAADGITPEMIKAQEERVNLIQRLLQVTTPDVRSEIMKQEAKLLDEQFFAIFNRLLESAMGSGQQEMANQMATLQKELMEQTEFGQQLQASMGEIEAAAKSLQEAGKELTREKLLNIMTEAPTEERLRALVSMARPGMDYTFFQTLTERIEKAKGDEKQKLEEMREKMLDFVNEIDQEVERRFKVSQEFIENLIAQDDIQRATQENLQAFNQETFEALNMMLRQASEQKDAQRMEKLQQVVAVLQAASAPPPELALIEEMLETETDAELEAKFKEHEQEISQEFIDMLGNLIAQIEAQGQSGEQSEEDKAVADRLQVIYRMALKLSMKRNMQ